ncbi:hypothetical protein [Bacillus sp. 196mf]|uniref:hypothetical protein n=1 Tax=Bacillus sp. 196mf TaxID=1761754 RepID=UPI000D7C4930|nr:hypothetical protein [Bacillus sp. 196mf]PYE88559.1 hypothetical protein ATL10_10446 [Bacillus sp. 196mf]
MQLAEDAVKSDKIKLEVIKYLSTEKAKEKLSPSQINIVENVLLLDIKPGAYEKFKDHSISQEKLLGTEEKLDKLAIYQALFNADLIPHGIDFKIDEKKILEELLNAVPDKNGDRISMNNESVTEVAEGKYYLL